MDDAEVVKSKVDIVEVISSYIPLKKAGRNLSGLCPFHGEKTPSFMVSAERQVFKCFGCGEGGDVFTFLEKIEGWDFREVLEELAKRVGVKLKSGGGSRDGAQKEKILAINRVAAKFFSYLLLDHKLGDEARKYLEGRGLARSMWVKFGLGWAPASWDGTTSVLKKKGFSVSDIAASGLVVNREGQERGFYDRFRGRLMFPIFDVRGGVLGFSGRVLVADAKSAKYINSPETAVFNKGSILFGYFQTKDSIREKNEAVLVEGEFDLLSLFAAGVKNVVAAKGTALTDNQVKILSRSCESVVVCFDADLAGDRAARRGVEMLDAAGLIVKVVNLGKFKDPDEFVKSDPDGLKVALKNAVNFYDFLIESARMRFDSATVYGKKKIGQELLPVISKIADEVVRAHYIGKIAGVLGIDAALIDKGGKPGGKPLAALEEHSDGSRGGENLERYFLALLLIGDSFHSRFYKVIGKDDFVDSSCGAFWEATRDIIENSKVRSKRRVLEALPESFKTFVDSLYLFEVGAEFLDEEERTGEMVKLAARIRELSLRRKLREISQRMREAEDREKPVEVAKLAREFDLLSQILKKGVQDGEKNAKY